MSNYVGRDPAPSGVILVGDASPVGMMGWFHTPATGWLQMNGQTVLKASYPDLWAYAQGFLTADQVLNPGLYLNVDANNFKVPNLSGLFVRGVGAVDANHTAAALGVKQLDGAGPLALKGITTTIAGGGGRTVWCAQDGDPVLMTTALQGTETKPVNVGLVPCVKALATTMIPVSQESFAFTPGTLVGFTLGNNVIDAVNDIDVLPGRCRGTGDAGNISLLAPLTKQLDAVWALGNNAGMRASGAAIADTTYHVFAIRRPDTGVVDVAADTDVNGANIPANTNAAYTQRRRIGSILRVAGTIRAFLQTGDSFTWKAPFGELNGQAIIVANRTLFALGGIPAGLKVEAMLFPVLKLPAVNGGSLMITDPDLPDIAATGSVFVAGASSSAMGGDQTANSNHGNQARCFTNTARQVGLRSNVAFNCDLFNNGYIDRRGRDDV